MIKILHRQDYFDPGAIWQCAYTLNRFIVYTPTAFATPTYFKRERERVIQMWVLNQIYNIMIVGFQVLPISNRFIIAI